MPLAGTALAQHQPGKGKSKTMNLPAALDGSSALGPLPFGGGLLDLASLGVSLLIALVFLAYLLRCYFQEFRRIRRIQRRKRLARLECSDLATDRDAVIEGCRLRRESAMAPRVSGLLPALDWRGLHSLIAAHDRVSLVWDTGLANEGALPRFYVEKGAAENKTVTSNGELTDR